MENYNRTIDKAIRRIRDVLSKKASEYATDINPYHNFDEGLKLSFHDQPEKVAWEYMTKHMRSIMDIIDKSGNGESVSRELICEKFGDAINYLILIEGMLYRRQNKHI